jgi:hypothetical protein
MDSPAPGGGEAQAVSPLEVLEQSAEIRKNLLEEYYKCLGFVDAFDSKVLQIKTWSVTLGAAIISAAYASKRPALLLFAAIASLIFFYLECHWKVFQSAYTSRARIIEQDLRKQRLEDHYYPQIGHVMRATIYGKGYRRAMDIAKSQHVALPHVAITGLSSTLWLLELWTHNPGTFCSID